jgi:hypothetical protein
MLFTVFLSVLASVTGEANRQLVQCVYDIAERHFEPGRSLVISDSTETYAGLHASSAESLRTLRKSDVRSLEMDTETWDMILAYLYLSARWPLLLFRLNGGHEAKYMTGSNHGSYIIAAGYRQLEDAVKDIRRQITGLKLSRDWNPRAKYLILVKQRGAFSEDGQKTLAADISTELWKYRIYNVVILIHAQEVRLQKADGQGELLCVLDAYASFPYRTRSSCGEGTEAVLLDRWIADSENDSHFLHNASLYPRKIPKDFHGCPLRASTFEYPPVTMEMTTKENGTIEYKEGLEARLLQQMARRTNMSIVYRPPPPNDEYWGKDFGNGTWTGLLGEVVRGYSDVALENFWYRCHLTNELECLVPHFIDSARWFVPCAKHYPPWTSITRVFEAHLWIGFLASYIIVSLFMWLVAKTRNKISSSYTHNGAYTSAVKCFLNFWAVILVESAPDDPPRELSIRCVFLMWVLYCWAVNTVYQTFLTSYLVDSGLQRQISSEDELLQSGMWYGFHQALLDIKPHLASKRYPRRILCVNFEQCPDTVAFKGDFAYVFSTLNTEYTIAKRYMDANGKPLICSFDEVISHELISIPVPKGLPMMDDLNKVIQDVIEAGLVEQWLKNIKYAATLSSARDFNPPPGEYTELSLQHLQSPFYFLFLGYALSVIAFIPELICRRK